MSTIVLMYHDVYRDSPSESGFQSVGAMRYKLKASKFEEQLQCINNIGKRIQDLEIIFTFDDGGISFRSIIAPLLNKYGIRGIFFITTREIGKPGFCTAEDIIQLQNDGHLIGSHNHIHRYSTTGLSQEQINFEWKHSMEILNKILGKTTSIVSLPNGLINRKILNAISVSNVAKIFSSDPTTKIRHRGNSLMIGRYTITNETSLDYITKLLTSQSYRRRIRFRNSLINSVKYLLGDFYSPLKTKFMTIIHGH